jgi:hypothetical protein
MDMIRQLIMDKWDIRRDVSAKIEGIILPYIMKELREQSRNLDMDVHRSGDILGEVGVKRSRRKNLFMQEMASIRNFMQTYIPFITYLREPFKKYADNYYSIDSELFMSLSFLPCLTKHNGHSLIMVFSCIHHS